MPQRSKRPNSRTEEMRAQQPQSRGARVSPRVVRPTTPSKSHENGMNGEGGSPSARKYETFVMTGDMIIQTTSPHHKADANRPEKANQPKEASPKKTYPSRIPKPNTPKSSPKTVPKQRRLSSDNESPLTKRKPMQEEKASVSEVKGTRNEEPMEIAASQRYPDAAMPLDIPPDDISSEDEKFKNDALNFDMEDLPPPPSELLTDNTPDSEGPSLSAELTSSGLSPAETADDLASESIPCSVQSQEVIMDTIEANLDLPASDSSCSIHEIACNGGPYDRSSISSESRVDVYQQQQQRAQEGIVVSRSAEKIGAKENGLSSSVAAAQCVRSSKSHENYLECNNTMAFVDIDFDDQMASSVDALMHYDQSTTSMDSVDYVQFQNNSPDSSPEKSTAPTHRERIPMLSGEEPRMISRLKEGCRLRDPSLPSSPPLKPDQNLAINTQTVSISGLPEQDSSTDPPESPSLPAPPPRTVTLPSNTSPADPIQVLCDENAALCSGPPSPGGESLEATSLYHQPAKDPHRPSAARLAKRLFHMDGFKKSDVTKHLSKKNDFAQLVGEEYLSFFDYSSLPLDVALRDFLKHVLLAGETQERERVLVHFSRRFVLCNPEAFNSEDACHTLTCALMLLNNDLHGQNIGRKMTATEFIENLSDLNDGRDFPKEILQHVYNSIKEEALECEFEDEPEDFDAMAMALPIGARAAMPEPVRFIGHNPFLDIPDPSKAVEYKKGFVMRKCCIDPDGRKTPLGKRSWKMFYATMRDMVIYLHKDEHGFKKSAMVAENMSQCIRIHHSLASKANDYKKKQHVFRLQTPDAAQYLFQTSDSKECEEWIDTINFVAASLSAPPLPGGVGSQKKFQRPLMPASYTKLNMREQLLNHEQRAAAVEIDLNEHRKSPPEKGAKSRVIQDYIEKEAYLHFELRRFNMYTFLLQAKMASFHPELEPSLVEVAIGEVDEPPSPPPCGGDNPLIPPPDSDKAKSISKPVQRSMSDRLPIYKPRGSNRPPQEARDQSTVTLRSDSPPKLFPYLPAGESPDSSFSALSDGGLSSPSRGLYPAQSHRKYIYGSGSPSSYESQV